MVYIAEELNSLRYYMRYRELAARVGVSLAGEENRSKAFGPSTEEEVLGLDYNTLKWKSWIPHDKSARLIRELSEILVRGEARNDDWMKVSGKLDHYHPLLLSGKFNRADFPCSETRKKAGCYD
jgi:hypothetical protein